MEALIKWQYFFGGGNQRYYKSEIKGVRVEKRITTHGSTYSIGNIDKAKTIYNTESDLLKAL